MAIFPTKLATPEVITSTMRLNSIPTLSRYKVDANLREEYYLTVNGDDLNSRTVLLNGKVLVVDTSTGTIHTSVGTFRARLSDPVTVSMFSIMFMCIAHMTVPTCK